VRVKTAYEFAVIGIGGIGSGAVYWLAREAGGEVLGLEQFAIGHDHGASQDHSRIIRLSYHAPEYTALTPETYRAWAEVEAESGVRIVTTCGGVDIAPDGAGEVLDQYAEAMTARGIPFDDWTAAEAMERFPQFRLDPGSRVLYQADSGLCDPRKAIPTQVALARARGATVLDNTPVRRLVPTNDGAELHTDAGVFRARHVVVAADAWTNEVLRETGTRVPLTITQEQVTYFSTPHLREFAPDRFPIWIWHGPESFYGFPVYGEVATKAGLDVGGDVVTTATRTYEPNPRPYQKLVSFLERYIPGSLGPELYTKSCLYTMPPDRNFVIDRLPDHPQIIVAQGAAHVFKFSSLVGKITAQLATTGTTSYPIGAFMLNRPALTDPAYPAEFRVNLGAHAGAMAASAV
jgi:sarcosine oxidase